MHDLGSLQRAADRVGRSQSTVSQQLRKLEEQVGQPLLRKQGRSLMLTEFGEAMLSYARRILELNDEVVAAAGAGDTEGSVGFGLPSDFAAIWLPSALGRFKRAHPLVRLEAGVDRTTLMLERLDRGELDLVLAFGAGKRADAEVLARLPLVWIGRDENLPPIEEPLPLVVFEPRCVFRKHAVSALEEAGRRWRVDFTSESLNGVWAAVEAGLGVTVRTAVSAPNNLVALNRQCGLPALPPIELCLHDGGRAPNPASERLRRVLLDTLPPSIAGATLPVTVRSS